MSRHSPGDTSPKRSGAWLDYDALLSNICSFGGNVISVALARDPFETPRAALF